VTEGDGAVTVPVLLDSKAVQDLASSKALELDGLRSPRITLHTPRKVPHTPRHASTFEVGGPLQEPFLNTHRTGVYFNRNAEIRADMLATPGAQTHLPAAYAIVRNLLEAEEAEQIWTKLAAPPSGRAAEPTVSTYNKSHAAFRKRYAKLCQGADSMKDAFGRYLDLDAAEISRIAIKDIRCISYTEGHDCPWHRDDPTSSFVVMVMLSDPDEDFEGGRLVVHAGDNPADTDAMPVHLAQGDAVILSAPRVDHAVQRVQSGQRVACIFEFAAVEEPVEVA